MAVPEGKRTESKLEVLIKARELALYTSTVCNNNKIFPKRDRWLLTNKIVEASLVILEEVATANSIYVASPSDYIMRRDCQTKAFAYTSRILALIELAYMKYNFEDNRIVHWTRLCTDTRNLIRKWKKSDASRFKEFKE